MAGTEQHLTETSQAKVEDRTRRQLYEQDLTGR
jgi:hypothetical protein